MGGMHNMAGMSKRRNARQLSSSLPWSDDKGHKGSRRMTACPPKNSISSHIFFAFTRKKIPTWKYLTEEDNLYFSNSDKLFIRPDESSYRGVIKVDLQGGPPWPPPSSQLCSKLFLKPCFQRDRTTNRTFSTSFLKILPCTTGLCTETKVFFRWTTVPSR